MEILFGSIVMLLLLVSGVKMYSLYKNVKKNKARLGNVGNTNSSLAASRRKWADEEAAIAATNERVKQAFASNELTNSLSVTHNGVNIHVKYKMTMLLTPIAFSMLAFIRKKNCVNLLK